MAYTKKIIGEGLQFKVYKISKNRVIKKPTTRSQKISKLKQWAKNDPRLLLRLKKDAIAAERITDVSIRGLRRIITRMDPAIIGNPRFLKHPNYEQDVALPLGKYLEKHSFNENKAILNEYVNNIIQAWRSGFSDTVFNFTINNGVKNGKVILLDLGELSFSKEKIKLLITKKTWLRHWSYSGMKDGKLKSYFERIMNLRITSKVLDKNWKARLAK